MVSLFDNDLTFLNYFARIALLLLGKFLKIQILAKIHQLKSIQLYSNLNFLLNNR